MTPSNFRDLTGQTFGYWTVIERDTSSPDHWHPIWRVRCVCGTLASKKRAALVKATRASCGCQPHTGPVNLKRRSAPGQRGLNQLYHTYKYMAKVRTYSFDLSKAEFETLTKQNCHYCMAAPSQRHKGTGYTPTIENSTYVYNGVDRLDNSAGYAVTNAVACCKACNYAKRDRSVAEFAKWVADLAENLAKWS